MKVTKLGLVLLTICLAAAARTPKHLNDPQLEETIQEALAHRSPESSGFWQDLGPRAPIVIQRMVAESRHPYRKARLVMVLGNYDTPDVASFLRDTALSSNNGTVRVAAIRALGQSQGMREEAFLVRALKSSNPHTRLAAAEALKQTGDRRAMTLVDTYVKQEKAPWVVARLKRN